MVRGELVGAELGVVWDRAAKARRGARGGPALRDSERLTLARPLARARPLYLSPARSACSGGTALAALQVITN